MDTVTARICVRRDTTSNWNLYPDFVPMLGEIIVYTDRGTINDVDVPGIKIGDGITPLVDLEFEGADQTADILEELRDHTENDDIHITSAERAYWNSKGAGSVSTITLNGVDHTAINGVVDLGNVLTAHQDISGKLNASLKGAANGLAELDSSGKVPAAQLPAYVDDVEEYRDFNSFPDEGESGKIYVAKDTNITYRWGGTSYVEIGSSLALGETSSTAYRGDRGKVAYDHATDSLRITSEQNVGLYKIGVTDEGHVASVEPVTKNDITNLGIPASDTTYENLPSEFRGVDVSLVTTGDKYRWDNKYTLPDYGIPASDIADGVIPDISTKADKTNTVFLTTVSLGRSAAYGSGTKSVAMGNNVAASGNYSNATNTNTAATGSASHAEGDATIASGYASHAEGGDSVASGYMAHAEGYGTLASYNYTHAEGTNTKATNHAAHAEGSGTTASGSYSHAEGQTTTASGFSSHAEGTGSTASGGYSHAEGNSTQSYGEYSHAEGSQSEAYLTASHAEGQRTVASGSASHSEGYQTIASGDDSHAEGRSTTASGPYSHAEGEKSEASGSSSHTEGYQTRADGVNAHAEGTRSDYYDTVEVNGNTYHYGAYGFASHAEGLNTVAAGSQAHAEGRETKAIYENSHAEGRNTKATKNCAHSEGEDTSANGLRSHAEGYRTVANGDHSHTEGDSTVANGMNSHAEGYGGSFTADGVSYTSGAGSAADHTEGYMTYTASNTQPGNHAEGYMTRATGGAAHAEGVYTLASGSISHAEGSGAKATAAYSHAEGYSTTASGAPSHAEGYITTSSGYSSHAEGYCSNATGSFAHAEGYYASANGTTTHVEGMYTVAEGGYSHVSGVYNVIDSYDNWPEWTANTPYEIGDKVKKTFNGSVEGYICTVANSDSSFTSAKWSSQAGKMNYAEIIGNGTSTSDRVNIRALDWDGNSRFKGDVYVGCNNDSTGGYKLISANDKGIANGVATLDANGIIPSSQLPDIQGGLRVVRLI